MIFFFFFWIEKNKMSSKVALYSSGRSLWDTFHNFTLLTIWHISNTFTGTSWFPDGVGHDVTEQNRYVPTGQKDLSQFQWKSAHAPKKELPKDFL